MTTAEILHLLKQTNQFEPNADVSTSDVVGAIEALQAEVDQLNDDVSMHMRVAVRAIDDCVELKEERDTLRADLQNSITRRQEQMAAADYAVASLKEENKILRQQLDGTNIVKWEVRYKQVLDQNNALKEERDKLRQHIKHIGNDALRSENHELRQQLAYVQKDAERYRFLRDHFATKSENSVDDFIALEPMTGEYFDAHIDILMSEFYADKKGTA